MYGRTRTATISAYNEHAFDKGWWEVDERFGFDPPEDEASKKKEAEWLKGFQKQRQSTTAEWNAFEKNGRSLSGTGGGGSALMITGGGNIKKMIRKGVPSAMRGKVWFERSGAAKKKRENEGVYSKYVATSTNLDSSVLDELQMDIARTFSMHLMFANIKTKQMMMRILAAFISRNPKYGYCQNMTCIIGMILFFLPEEDAFWLFTTIIEDILPVDFCSPTLIGLRVDQMVLEVMIKERLPKLHSHFFKFDVDISCFTTSWLLRLFVGVFPIETTLRVWDCFLNEGSKILFRVALAFLKLHEDLVRGCTDSGELLTLLNKTSKTFYDADKLIKTCGTFWNMQRKHITEMRNQFIQEVKMTDAKLNNRRNKEMNGSTDSLKKEEEDFVVV